MPAFVAAGIELFAAYAGTTMTLTAGQILLVANATVLVGGLALSNYQQRRAKSKMRDAYNAQQVDRLANVVTTVAQRDLVLGRVRKGGAIYFRGSTGQNKQNFIAQIALAGHEIDAVEQIYFNDEPVQLDENGYVISAPYLRTPTIAENEGPVIPAGGTASILPRVPVPGSVVVSRVVEQTLVGPRWVVVPSTVVGNTVFIAAQPTECRVSYQYLTGDYKARVWWELGSPNAVADARTKELFPGLWTDSHRARGVAKLFVEFTFDDTSFPTGAPPTVTARIRGAKVFDPRTGTTAWSDNPALLMRHVYAHPQFGKATVTAAEDARIIAAANACDANQSWVVNGSVQAAKLYRANLVVPYGAAARDVLDDLSQAMGGMWAFAGGELHVRAGVYTAPVMTLTDADLAVIGRQVDGDDQEPVGISVHRERAQKFNTVNVRIWDAAQDYKQVALTPLKPAALVARDGAELAQEVQLAGVGYAPQALHVAGIMLRDARDPLTFEAAFKLRAWPLELFDTVSLTLARYGWTAKTFMVLRREWDRARGVVRLTLKETAAAIYQPDAGFPAQGFAVNTALPRPWDVQPPVLTGIFSGSTELLRGGDGTLTTRVRVAWQQIADASLLQAGFVDVEWVVVGSGQPAQRVTVTADRTEAFVLGPQDGQVVLIRVRARNAIAASSWSVQQAHEVLGKSEPPPDVPFMIVAGTVATWGSVSATDLAGYRLRAWAQAGTPNWSQAAPLHEGVLTATVLDLAGRLEGVSSLLVKAVDTSGNESATARAAAVPLLSTLAGNTFTSWPQAPGFAGAITGGAVSGGVLQAADSGDLFWPATNAALFWGADNTANFWPAQTWLQMVYECSLTTPRAGTLAIQSTITGSHVVEVQRDDQTTFWGNDANAFWGDNAASFWPAFTPVWQAWPGALGVAIAEPVRLRVTVNGGATRGQITAFTPFLDVPTLRFPFQQFAVGAGGTRVALPTGWTQVRGVTGTVVNTGGAGVTLTQEDFAVTPGPLIAVRNASGVLVAGVANGEVIGF
jgi:hypothetical protein